MAITLTRAMLPVGFLALAGLSGCCSTCRVDDHKAHHGGHHAEAVTEAIAIVYPTAGNNCRGWVRFVQEGGHVRVTAEISGLKPNSAHGFHVHEFGDASAPDALSAGSHYNPHGHDHGLPPSEMRHPGDLGNLIADANGVAKYERIEMGLSIVGGEAPVLGRSVIVHVDPDDGSQPVGNAGARIGIGVIGVAQPGD